MRLMTPIIMTIAAAMWIPGAASAQVVVDFEVRLPQIRFEAPPPVVVVTPGITVVPDYDEEIFVVGGWYWLRGPRGWYRAKDHRGGWVLVVDKDVPPGLVKFKPGKYKRWKNGGPPGHGGIPPGHLKHGKGKGKH